MHQKWAQGYQPEDRGRYFLRQSAPGKQSQMPLLPRKRAVDQARWEDSLVQGWQEVSRVKARPPSDQVGVARQRLHLLPVSRQPLRLQLRTSDCQSAGPPRGHCASHAKPNGQEGLRQSPDRWEMVDGGHADTASFDDGALTDGSLCRASTRRP